VTHRGPFQLQPLCDSVIWKGEGTQMGGFRAPSGSANGVDLVRGACVPPSRESRARGACVAAVHSSAAAGNALPCVPHAERAGLWEPGTRRGSGQAAAETVRARNHCVSTQRRGHWLVSVTLPFPRTCVLCASMRRCQQPLAIHS